MNFEELNDIFSERIDGLDTYDADLMNDVVDDVLLHVKKSDLLELADENPDLLTTIEEQDHENKLSVIRQNLKGCLFDIAQNKTQAINKVSF